MKRTCFLLLLHIVYLSSFCTAQNCTCEIQTEPSGEISDLIMKRYSYEPYRKCWTIKVPEGSYVRLNLKELHLNGMSCSDTYVKISVAGTNEEYKFCSQDTDWKPVIALSEVTVTYSHVSSFGKYFSLFRLKYSTENIICARKDHFRCSNHTCVYQSQVCDGIMDCEYGEDEAGCVEETSDQKNRTSKHVPYSLYIGDQKDVIYTISLRVPENSSAYDIMTAAQIIHPKYRFLHHNIYGHPYVYEIAGIKSDPETGKFWYPYTYDSGVNGLVKHDDKSPDTFTVGDGQHLIMWYKTSQG